MPTKKKVSVKITVFISFPHNTQVMVGLTGKKKIDPDKRHVSILDIEIFTPATDISYLINLIIVIMLSRLNTDDSVYFWSEKSIYFNHIR